MSGASLSVAPGEVHALLGGNGAGKSTLLRVLSGLIQPDSGRILLSGEPVRITSPRDAWSRGLGMVHQHFTLVQRLTVLENLTLGTSGLSTRARETRVRAEELMRSTGLQAPLDARVEDLGVGDRQRVEILKVLLKDPRVLILDEPTAVLAPLEVETLLALLRTLAREGRTIVLVAHKLDEVLSVASRVTVLRDGRTVLERRADEVDAAALVSAMVGSIGTDEAAQVEIAGKRSALDSGPVAVSVEAELLPERALPSESGLTAEVGPRTPTAPLRSRGELVARLVDVSVTGSRGERALSDVSVDVHRGEIVGVAGVEGNGQRELAQVLSGRRVPDRGSATLPDEPGFIPQDRNREGLIADFTIAENVALAAHRQDAYRNGPLLRLRELDAHAEALIAEYGIRVPNASAWARTLSGGNAQRVVVAREMATRPELLVAENPTRGLDVTAAAFVHRRLQEMREAGVVLISTDLDEVLRLSDRVLVMSRGRLLAVPADARTREGVGRLMLAGDAPTGTSAPITP